MIPTRAVFKTSLGLEKHLKSTEKNLETYNDNLIH